MGLSMVVRFGEEERRGKGGAAHWRTRSRGRSNEGERRPHQVRSAAKAEKTPSAVTAARGVAQGGDSGRGEVTEVAGCSFESGNGTVHTSYGW
jgi:hypothetical protein